MLVTITQFSRLASDEDGKTLPLGKDRLACQALTAAGSFTALNDECRFIRIATDTAIQMDIAGGSTTSADELINAGTSEYFAVDGGETLAITEV